MKKKAVKILSKEDMKNVKGGNGYIFGSERTDIYGNTYVMGWDGLYHSYDAASGT